MPREACTHQKSAMEQPIRLSEEMVCEDCVKSGGEWVHLRTCQECGKTYCCENSPNKHAEKHHAASGHPVIASAEPGEFWLWCYEDHKYFKYK